MRAYLELPRSLKPVADALARRGLVPGRPEEGLILAWEAPQDWDGVEEALLACYRLTRQAAAAGAPMVYLVRQPDLLGWNGAPAAMLADALVSAARALAMEGQKRQLSVNVVGYEEPPDPEAVAGWVEALLVGRGITGSVVQLGAGHLGKVVP